MTRSEHQRLVDLWRAIGNAGGVDAYVRGQLRERGFVLERKDTAQMSKAQLAAYKKSLKEEAAERRRLKKEAWVAYRATHLVHLGEGIHWSDDADVDRFDHPRAEERAEVQQSSLGGMALALGLGGLAALFNRRKQVNRHEIELEIGD